MTHMMMPSRARIFATALAVTIISLMGLMPARAAEPAAPAKVTFNRDIRPILSDKCFFCHGPDAKKRQAKLRLDDRDVALGKKAFVPGKADASEMIRRILATDDDHMPPVKSKLAPLTRAEVAKLRQWINDGAEYQAHWSFIPLTDEGGHLKDQGIDKFVSAALAKRGLKLQPEASPETLVRRISFDLTGLPPTPAEVETFVTAYRRSPQSAVENLVTALLASPRYGERMAVDWLDVARYADSYGFQVDREREVWPWRDWVIKAFNENLPYDQFITWQLAGDLLPNPTDEQVLATAFNRLHQQENEGGSVEEEYRVEYVCDRVQTFATAFLGLTFECSRCHDHKFDPIKQTDYYGLFAMFGNIDEAGLYSYFTNSPPTPAMMMMDASQKTKLSELSAKVSALEKQLAEQCAAGAPTGGPRAEVPPVRAPAALTPIQVGSAPRTDSPPLENTVRGADPTKLIDPIASYTFDSLIKKNQLANSVKANQPATLKGANKLVPGHSGQAVLFTGDDAVDLPLGNFQRHDPFGVSLWLQTPDVKDRAVVFHRSQAWTDAASRGYELLIEDGKLKWSLIHFWPGNAISIRTKENVPVKQWIHVVVTSDGSSRAGGLKIIVDDKIAPIDIIRDNLTKNITGGGHDNISLGERMRDRGFKGGMIDDFQVFDRDVTMPVDEKTKPLLAELHAARAAVTQYADGLKDMMVMRELPQPKKAYILFRGQYNQRRAEVEMHAPTFLSPFPKDAPRNRLGLAKWLTDPRHPLTARVTVNRFWQSLFGRGLVKTAEDFGSQGARPLYPELLDYLALKFIRSGWDTKALIREIVTSQVYLQRSVADVALMTDDPDNEWLARGPRFRLPAEMIRDNALAASGLLAEQLGGPPVNPYEMSEAFKPGKPSAGTGVYRRSLYTTWRRTSPPPAMVAFDAPRRAVCTAKRERTDSPLQAMILLNGTQYVEAARVLGEKLYMESKGDVPLMIEQGFLRCLSRKPDAKEIEIVTQLYAEQLAHFKEAPKDAEALLKVGNAKRDASVPAPEAAATTVLAQTLMNHDACVVKR
jgi:cytochrome c553